jgi:hypothetical protein
VSARKAIVVVGAAFVFAAACSTASGIHDPSTATDAGTFGQFCEADSQCGDGGLSCQQMFVGHQCSERKVCTMLCLLDKDCKAIDPRATCLTCTAEKTCAPPL